MKTWVRRSLLIAGGVIAVLAAAILTLPLWLPTGAIEREIARAVRQGIGRDLVIRGPLHAGLFPVRLEGEDAALVQERQGDAPPFITTRKLKAVLSLPRLLRGVVTITDLSLQDPVFLFSVDAQGRANWTGQGDASSPAKPPVRPASADEARRRGSENQGFSLDSINVENGIVRFQDARSKAQSQIEALGLHASLPGIDEPLTAEGGFTWRGRPVKILVTLADPGQIGGGGESMGRFEVSADAGHATFDGRFEGQGETLGQGNLKLDVPSVQQLAAWAGTTVSLPGPGTLSLAGKATLYQDKVALSDATLSFDQIKGTGSLSSGLGSKRPSLEGTLALGDTDLTPYLGVSDKPADASGGSLDPGALPDIDLALTLSAAGVKLPSLTLGRSAVHVTLTGNTLVADRIEVPFGGGRVSGRLSLTEAGADSLSWDAAMLLERLRLEQLAQGGKVTGTGSADLRLTARGKSRRELLASLSGHARVSTVNTQIRGVHLPSLIGNVPGAVIAAASGRDVPADRATIQATFELKGGVARTDDLDIKSEAVRLTGAGTVDLGRERLDLLLTPRILSPSAVSIVGVRLSGLMVPILVQGAWSAPSYTPLPSQALKQHLGDPLQSLKDITSAQPAGSPAAPGTDSGFDPLGWLDRQFR